LSEILSGDATYYATGLGACGITNTDSNMIAAASELLFDTFPGYEGGNPNNNPICNKQVSVTYGGTTILVTITDRCAACAYGSLDFSPSAFQKLAPLSVGRLHGIDWHFTS
jgi:expansin (peptidoglycan-binding protein)